MKQCPKCGTVINDSEHFCPTCGTAVPDAGTDTYNPPVNSVNAGAGTAPGAFNQPAQNDQQTEKPSGLFGDYVPPIAKTKREFMQLPEGESYYKSCRSAAIICYICAGISLVLVCFVMGQWSALIDIALLVGLGLGVHLAQSLGCAIALLVYSIINVLVLLVTTGRFGGWLVLIAGIDALVSTIKTNRAWKQYVAEHKDRQNQPYQQAAYPQQNQTPVYAVPPMQSEPGANEWKCPNCGKINQNNVGSCGCGTIKPQ